MRASSSADLRRRLPSVDQLLQDPRSSGLVERHGRGVVLRVLRRLLDTARERAAAGDEAGLQEALDRLGGDLADRVERARRPSLVRVLNATGVVVHTSLGRAPLSPGAAAQVAEIASSYSNLEYDLAAGERSDREAHAEARLRELLGAEGTVVVNNCAAAVLLALNTLADGREVLVSRGELVEIGGSFRVPDVMAKSNAILREVGTTNRTRIADYERAINERTRLIFRVHRSNFQITGFTEEPRIEDLVALAKKRSIPLVEDLGSGVLFDLNSVGVSGEPGVLDSLRAGVEVVAYSGDKLLGGPQAGILSGRSDLIA